MLKNRVYLERLSMEDRETAERVLIEAFKDSSTSEKIIQTFRAYFDDEYCKYLHGSDSPKMLTMEYYSLKKRNNTKPNNIIGITGLYTYNWMSKEVFWLGWFAIKNDKQGKGLGKFLLEKSIDLAKEKGARLFCIESSSDYRRATNLYKKMGFDCIGPLPWHYDDKKPLCIFFKHLIETRLIETKEEIEVRCDFNE